MKNKLDEAQMRFFRENGYLFPVTAIDAGRASQIRLQLERHEQSQGLLKGTMLHRPHLLFTWAASLIRDPGILDAVEGILGPNILAWSSGFFIKEARDRRFVSWHQDSTYWGMEPPDIITAWLALSESDVQNGAMRVIPQTHLSEQMPHRETLSADNMLSRGQEVAVDVDEDRAVALELAAGQMSLHHVRLVHGSEPNPTDRRRIGLAIRYMPTYVRQTTGVRDTATLVRGVDEFGNFDLEPAPRSDLSPEALRFLAHVCRSKDAVQKAVFTDSD